jgi:hypothetical protein
MLFFRVCLSRSALALLVILKEWGRAFLRIRISIPVRWGGLTWRSALLSFSVVCLPPSQARPRELKSGPKFNMDCCACIMLRVGIAWHDILHRTCRF